MEKASTSESPPPLPVTLNAPSPTSERSHFNCSPVSVPPECSNPAFTPLSANAPTCTSNRPPSRSKSTFTSFSSSDALCSLTNLFPFS